MKSLKRNTGKGWSDFTNWRIVNNAKCIIVFKTFELKKNCISKRLTPWIWMYNHIFFFNTGTITIIKNLYKLITLFSIFKGKLIEIQPGPNYYVSKYYCCFDYRQFSVPLHSVQSCSLVESGFDTLEDS